MALGAQPFGIELVERPMYQLRCGRVVWMVLLNRMHGGAEAVRKLCAAAALPALVARRDELTGRYAVAYLALTSPAQAAGRVQVTLHRPLGGVSFAGTLTVTEGRAELELRALARPGAFPVRVRGTFEAGALTRLEGASGAVSAEKLRPTRLRRGGAAD